MGEALVTNCTGNCPDDQARALLKKTCDQAYQRGCDVLARYEATKLELLEQHCKDATTAEQADACLEAGTYFKDSYKMPVRPSNVQKARALFDTACKLGNQAGCALRDQAAP